MPRNIHVYYPSGKQMTLPLSKWFGLVEMGGDAPKAIAVMVDHGKGDKQNPIMILDPRGIVVYEDTGEWLYNPRLQNLDGEMGKWMRDHDEWGWKVPGDADARD